MTTDAQALNEQLKSTAGIYNSQPGEGGPEEEAARLAAAELNRVQGSIGHDGQHEIIADTPEQLAAAKVKADAATAEAKKATADKEAAEKLAKETPEDRAVREATEAAAKESSDKQALDAASNAEWVSTDNKEFNAAMGLMKSSGMTAAEATVLFDEAVVTGDLSKVDKAALVDKVGEDKAALIMAGFTTYIETAGQAALAKVKAAHDAVGGADNWSKMQQWARGKAAGDNAFRTKVESISAMIGSDNALQVQLGTQEFLSMYNGDRGNSTVGAAELLTPHAAASAPAQSTATPMSAREYADGVADASTNLRGAAQVAKLKELSSNRQAGRNAGL